MYISDANKEQARKLAKLIQLARGGMPYYIWQLEGKGNADPIDIGSKHISREQSSISYKHARVCIEDDKLLGLAQSYRLSDSPSLLNLHKHPDPIIPLLMLETKAPGAWYLHAIAVEKSHRNRGVAKLLMRDTEILAEHAGCNEIALTVNSSNKLALSIYGSMGYTSKDQMRAVPFPGCPEGSHWILMTKDVPKTASAFQRSYG